jgi:hypothetical protein
MVVVVCFLYSNIVSYSQDNIKNFDNSQPISKGGQFPQVGSNDSIPKGTPQIYIPETSHDFGSIMQGSKISHTFKVYNKGDAPLKLIEAKGS